MLPRPMACASSLPSGKRAAWRARTRASSVPPGSSNPYAYRCRRLARLLDPVLLEPPVERAARHSDELRCLHSVPVALAERCQDALSLGRLVRVERCHERPLGLLTSRRATLSDLAHAPARIGQLE